MTRNRAASAAFFVWGKRVGLAGLVATALFGIASAGVLIEQLGAAATPADTDLVPTVQGSSPAKQQSLGAIAAYMAARSETLTNKTINCVSGNTCTLPGGGGGGTSWTVQASKSGAYTLVASDAGTIIPDTGNQILFTFPANTGGSVFAAGKQFMIANLGSDFDSISVGAGSTIYGVPTSSATNSWIPAGATILVTIDASGNYFGQYLSSPVNSLHTMATGTISSNVNASNCIATYVSTAVTTVTFTVPTGLPTGCHAEFIQGAAGTITVAAGSGFTLTSPHGYTHTFAQGSMIGIAITSSTTGVFYGDGA